MLGGRSSLLNSVLSSRRAVGGGKSYNATLMAAEKRGMRPIDMLSACLMTVEVYFYCTTTKLHAVCRREMLVIFIFEWLSVALIGCFTTERMNNESNGKCIECAFLFLAVYTFV